MLKHVLVRWCLACVITTAGVLAWFMWPRVTEQPRALEVVQKTWSGYKQLFVTADGRVRRLPEDDTVSEGQAYAMLRAAWLKDKAAFDLCYRWTEEHLSRRQKTGDGLLAWRWRAGKVQDWMPATDADLDYALSLFFAEALWPGAAPAGLAPYGQRAARSADDILRRLTYQADEGRLFLSPWILAPGARAPFPVNPSYYSPAHFRIIYQRTGDARWLRLIATTYRLLGRLAHDPRNGKNSGLVPDWCAVGLDGRLSPLPGKSSRFGWDAVRVPFRVGWDLSWFKAPQAEVFFRSGLADFVAREWAAQGALLCDYRWDGLYPQGRENPAFYAAYYYALAAVGSSAAPALLRKTRSFLIRKGERWNYGRYQYYDNSLAWLADGLACGVVKDIEPEARP